jgi:hypothetical protein
MDIKDIRENVLLQINKDTESLLYACSTDKMSRTLCSSKSYWVKRFKQHNLVLPTVNYTSPNGWIFAFEKARLLQLYISNIINTQNEDILEYGLTIGMNTCSILDIFNVEGIDVEKLSLLNDRNLLDTFMSNTNGIEVHLGINYVTIEFKPDNTYLITLDYYSTNSHKGTKFSYQISQTSMEQILYNALSRNVIIYDADGDPIKYYNM